MSKSKNSKSKTISKNNKINLGIKVIVFSIIGVVLAIIAFTVAGLVFIYGYDREWFNDTMNMLKVDFNSPNMALLIIAMICFLTLIFVIGNMMIAKKKIENENFDDSENSYYSKNSTRLSVLCGFSNIVLIITITSIFLTLQNSMSSDVVVNNRIYIYLINCVNSLLSILIQGILYQNIISKVQPEKYNNIFSLNFNSKYCDSLDEYEFKKSGKSAIKSVGMISWLFFALLGVGIVFQMSLQYYIGITLYQVVFIIVQIVNNVKNKVNLP